MTARFEPPTRTFGSVRGTRLSLADQIILMSLLASLTVFLFPAKAVAQADLSAEASAKAENKTRLIFEIKNFPTIKIDEPSVEIEDVAPVADPDIVHDPSGKIYMHEPAIKTYVCPKLKGKCKTFIAILKAENGTHECTRDNKGLNKNGSVDVGLAQINWHKKSPYTMDQLRDCKFNLDIALAKYETRGFSPWVVYTTGAYKKHLKYID